MKNAKVQVVIIIVLNTTRMALERLHQATHDPLTGLPNLRLFDEHLETVLQGRGRDRVGVMIIDLDRFKLINDLKVLDGHGHTLDVSVNLSATTVVDLSFARTLRKLLIDVGTAPDRLILELTENSVVSDVERAMRVMSDLTAIGVRIALDDFGTGYSSLSNLRELPLQAVKIDRSFVTGLNSKSGATDAVIVSAVLALAAQLGLTAVAEGIED